MNSPFTIIRGGLAPETPVSTEFVRFDRPRAIIDQIKADFIAERDQFILRKRRKAEHHERKKRKAITPGATRT